MAMVAYKRKRSYSPRANALLIARPYKRPTLARRNAMIPVVPGRTRIGGNYGRYAPMGGELKFFDVDLDDSIVASGGTITDSVNKIVQGVTEIQRIGRKCTIRSFNWHYRMQIGEKTDQAGPVSGDAVRVILYLDKQCNGAVVAAVTDILETADWQSFRNLANSGRFNILMDKTHVLNYNTMASHGFAADTFDLANVIRDFSFYKKCSIPIEFSGTTGAITEIKSNNLGILILSSNGLAGFFSKIRLRFSDH